MFFVGLLNGHRASVERERDTDVKQGLADFLSRAAVPAPAEAGERTPPVHYPQPARARWV